MNGALLLIVGTAILTIAYFTYGRYLASLFGVDPSRKTPAHFKHDGVDYVPTKLPVLFGHHFASIAGAGPIVGPIAAAHFGWLPVLVWLIIGCVFIGAMHDLAALYLSVRADGRSIGHVIEEYVGYSGRQIFLLFCFAALLLVVAVFAILVAKTFVTTPAVATSSILFIAMAPCFGFLVYKKNVSIMSASLFFVPLLFVFVWVGSLFPCDLTSLLGVSTARAQQLWLIVLCVYVFIASVIPVWALLQPRDYLNSYLLYAMILLGLVSVVVASPTMCAPMFEGFTVIKGGANVGIFPLLFVTVACGACSGFHALVASGTTSKQLDSEGHILPVGYGAMLVEGVLAIMALVSVAYLAPSDMAAIVSEKGPVVAFASGLAVFCGKLGIPEALGMNFFTLAISAFLLTTLDTATRLTRFTWQELFLPGMGNERRLGRLHGVFSNRYTATVFVLLGAAALALMKGSTPTGEEIPVWRIIWPVFGASNQLLAALTLLLVTMVLIKRKSNYLVSLLPMLFMMFVCMWALCDLFMSNISAEKINWALVIATGFLIIMALVLVVQAVVSIKRARIKE